LFDKSTLKGEKGLINKTMVPASRGAFINDITDFGCVRLTVVGCKDLVTILTNDPIIFPDLDGLAISYFPATSLLNSVNSLVDALPSITGTSATGGMNYVRVRVIFSFEALGQKGMRVSLESPYLLGQHSYVK
jgi:hypothetical protein